MISNQETLNLSPFMAIYDIVVPKDNMLSLKVIQLLWTPHIQKHVTIKSHTKNFVNLKNEKE